MTKVRIMISVEVRVSNRVKANIVFSAEGTLSHDHPHIYRGHSCMWTVADPEPTHRLIVDAIESSDVTAPAHTRIVTGEHANAHALVPGSVRGE